MCQTGTCSREARQHKSTRVRSGCSGEPTRLQEGGGRGTYVNRPIAFAHRRGGVIIDSRDRIPDHQNFFCEERKPLIVAVGNLRDGWRWRWCRWRRHGWRCMWGREGRRPRRRRGWWDRGWRSRWWCGRRRRRGLQRGVETAWVLKRSRFGRDEEPARRGGGVRGRRVDVVNVYPIILPSCKGVAVWNQHSCRRSEEWRSG